jgi:hypothetical protein
MKAVELAESQNNSWRNIAFTLTAGLMSVIAWLQQFGFARLRPRILAQTVGLV